MCYTRDVLRHKIGGVSIDAVIADAPVPGVKHKLIVIDKDWFKGAEGSKLTLPPPARDFSVIFSSSGSTGRPKLIENDAGATLNRLSTWISYGHYGERTLPAMGERTHAHFMCVLTAICRGGTIIGVSDRKPQTILETMQLF